jgi:sugar lactone lactonase YvrE
MELRCVVKSDDRLGEGPCWSPFEGRLYWFDIKGQRLGWYEPKTDARGAFDLPFRASAGAPRAKGGLIMATDKGLAFCDPIRGTLEMARGYEFPEGFRTNDGKIDIFGNFWWSTMDDNHGVRTGSVFRTGPDLETQQVLSGIHIPNTVSMSPDGKVLYVADTKLQTIFAHQMDDVSKVTMFAHTAGAPASPDGSAIDAEGYLWNAQWGGWRVVRYAPDGAIDRIVTLPVQNPTSCAFGGEDMTTLYITSAWDELPLGSRPTQPLAGALFALETGIEGLSLPLFAG